MESHEEPIKLHMKAHRIEAGREGEKKSTMHKRNADDDRKIEVRKHCHNIIEVLKCSNATPIRNCAGIGYMCSYCDGQYPDPRDLKKHTLTEHASVARPPFLNYVNLTQHIIKLDITNLTCNLCKASIDTIEAFIIHLNDLHNKKMYTDINNHIIPFKFDGEELKCCICTECFSKFKVLQTHMHVHYKNYFCDNCEAGFVNLSSLKSHRLTHQSQQLKCNYCPKVFKNKTYKKSHEIAAHIKTGSLYKCGYCVESFGDFRKRETHLSEKHGVTFAAAKCTACDKVYKNFKNLKEHVKKNHLMMRPHKCSECDKAFFGSHDLKSHMICHTGLKRFICDTCSKAFTSKHNLVLHMSVHTGERRHKCKICSQNFIQRCSLRRHLITKHSGIDNT